MEALSDQWLGPRRPRMVPRPAREWQAWWARVRVAEHLAVARMQGYVVSTGQLERAGVTRAATRHAVRNGSWVRARYGVVGVVDLAAGGPSQHLLERRRHAMVAGAGALVRPDHVVGARSAAILQGLPTLEVPDRAELIDCEPFGTGRRAASLIYPGTVTMPEVDRWFGVPVTTVSRVITDLARHDRRDGLMAADAALREGLVTPAELETALERATGWPGVRQARVVLGLATPLADSPLESLLRLAMHDDGFPPPQPQFEVGPFWVDLALPRHGLLIEADGREKYVDDALWQEKRREQYLRRAGWQVERVIWSDVLRGWAETSHRLRSALRAP